MRRFFCGKGRRVQVKPWLLNKVRKPARFCDAMVGPLLILADALPNPSLATCSQFSTILPKARPEWMQRFLLAAGSFLLTIQWESGSLRGFCGVSAGFCGGPQDFARFFRGSDPMLVTLENRWRVSKKGDQDALGTLSTHFFGSPRPEGPRRHRVRYSLEHARYWGHSWGHSQDTSGPKGRETPVAGREVRKIRVQLLPGRATGPIL